MNFVPSVTQENEDLILLFCVWWKSRELGGRDSPRFACVTPVVESYSSSASYKLLGRVAFRILSKAHDGALSQK